MTKILRTLIISLFITMVVFSLTACNSDNAQSNVNGKRTIKIGYLPITHAVPPIYRKRTRKKPVPIFSS